MLEIDLNKADVSFLVSYEAGSLKKTTSDRALAANALAAVNGTYFNTSTGNFPHVRRGLFVRREMLWK